MANPIQATASNSTSNTAGYISPLTVSATQTTTDVTPGFGFADLTQFEIVNYKTGAKSLFYYNYEASITDAILQKNMMGASTFTLQLTDPNRELLRNLIQQGTVVKVAGLQFVLTQFVKASNQIQLVFESAAINLLRQQRGNGSINNPVGTNVTGAMHSFVSSVNVKSNPFGNLSLVAPDYVSVWNQLTSGLNKTGLSESVALGRGTTSDPYEDTWTAMTRIASSIGWRLWENNNVIFFGPDEYWLGEVKDTNGVLIPSPVNAQKGTLGSNIQIMKEFQPTVQLIDFDWDVGKPFGQATATCMMDKFTYDIGEIVTLQGMGPADGQWMISSMQRDYFNPQASVVLQVPMPFAQAVQPNSLPLPPFPLTVKTK